MHTFQPKATTKPTISSYISIPPPKTQISLLIFQTPLSLPSLSLSNFSSKASANGFFPLLIPCFQLKALFVGISNSLPQISLPNFTSIVGGVKTPPYKPPPPQTKPSTSGQPNRVQPLRRKLGSRWILPTLRVLWLPHYRPGIQLPVLRATRFELPQVSVETRHVWHTQVSLRPGIETHLHLFMHLFSWF